jgi:hypothetical protein
LQLGLEKPDEQVVSDVICQELEVGPVLVALGVLGVDHRISGAFWQRHDSRVVDKAKQTARAGNLG